MLTTRNTELVCILAALTSKERLRLLLARRELVAVLCCAVFKLPRTRGIAPVPQGGGGGPSSPRNLPTSPN